jgi:beta-glucosidase
MVSDASIGTTFSLAHIQPFRQTPADLAAAGRVDDLLNKFFLYPALGKGYPLEKLGFLKKIEKYMLPDDPGKMQADLDFIGVQTYTREIVKNAWAVPLINATIVNARKRQVPFTEMGWEVYPRSIYDVLKQLSGEPGIPPIIITENGAAFADEQDASGNINDQQRSDYIRDHIDWVLRARNEGVDVRGYFVWSFTDNFEWAEGYRPRFGLVHVDYHNQLHRTIKASGKWYSEFIRNQQHGLKM